jgi:hypothetical protein
MAPGTFTALPTNRTTINKMPVGTITDIAPLTNIGTFGMCNSLANPSVAAATAAALGVLTPMPCVPSPVGPWTPAAPRTSVGKVPVLAMGCTAMCAWGGVIQVVAPGQFTVRAT